MIGATLRSLGSCWLRGDPDTQSWLPPSFTRADERRRQVLAARDRGTHPTALAAMRTKVNTSRASAQRAIGLLEQGEAAAVVTGQQAGLLLGPLYTFHKALSTVLTAQALEQETGVPCVSVFWLQDEDHDFEEIAGLSWIDDEAQLRHDRLTDVSQERVPLGDRTLPQQVRPLVEKVRHSLRTSRCVKEADDLLEPWTQGGAWSDAFGQALAKVFEAQPLLILRGRSPELARGAALLHRRSLDEAEAVGGLLDARARALEEAGFRVQVPIRLDRSLSFFQPAGVGGPRHRLRVAEGRFFFEDRAYGHQELVSVLETEPQCFSTSALLRPLVQDSLLPVAAQLVGPGEASYLAQLAPLRDKWGIAAPLVVPRGRALWVEDRPRRRLRDLEITPDEGMSDPTALLARRLDPRVGLDPDRLRAQLLDPLESAFEGLGPLEGDLERARAKTMISVRRNVERFMGRAARARAQEDATAARRLAEARVWLLPGNHPQERTLGLTDLVARNGLQRLRACFEASFQPFSSAVMELHP